MNDSFLFLRGLVIGFALAAPVGPVGVLCIRRALADGRYAAFVAGLGAAVADTFFGAVAGLGLTVVSSFLISHQASIRLVGGSFLVVLGLRSLRSVPEIAAVEPDGRGLVKDFLVTFLLTLSNPATLLAALGVFAALGALRLADATAAGKLILGVFTGSSLWWLVLSAAASAARTRVSPGRLRLLNQGSGLILTLSGLGILAATYFLK
jgi:threonine/homoserine/homoserine lactone efflux protein